MKHTPEPWDLVEIGDNGRHFCLAKDGVSILTTAIEYQYNGEPIVFGAVYEQEDANRIIACVNACAEFENPELEISRLKKQREELVAMLERMISFPADFKCSARLLINEIKGII